MHFHVLTLFPDMILHGVDQSILHNALDKDIISVEAVNIRDYTTNKHGKVDDYTYGGGAGLLMQAQPVYDAWRSIQDRLPNKARVVYMTPTGRVFNQSVAEEFSREEDLILLCGHYEGIDERVIEEIVTDKVSIGDFVLTGGELPAMMIIDAVSRLIPGVLHNDVSAETDSFQNGLLEYPQYSRPEVWMDRRVPEILLSGDHGKVDAWRLEQSLAITKEVRPDLYEAYMEAHPPVVKKKRRHRRKAGSVVPEETTAALSVQDAAAEDGTAALDGAVAADCAATADGAVIADPGVTANLAALQNDDSIQGDVKA